MTAFTAIGNDLFDALSNVLQHVSSDATLPILTSVQVIVDDAGLVTLVGTDRYSLGVAELVVLQGIDYEPGSFLLPGDMAKTVVKAAKSMRGASINIKADENTVTVTTYEGTSSGRTELGEYPKWRSLWPDDADAATCSHPGIIFSRRNLAKLSKVFAHGSAVTRGEPTWAFKFGNTPVRPVIATTTSAPDFRVLLMPCRAPS